MTSLNFYIKKNIFHMKYWKPILPHLKFTLNLSNSQAKASHKTVQMMAQLKNT